MPSEENTALANINLAKNALEQARDLSSVLEIRSQAMAIQAYASAKGADEAANLAVEIKLRSERKAGTFLKEMPKAEGHKFGAGSTKLGPPALKDLGISKNESSRWQRIASIPEERFEEYLNNATRRTQTALLSEAARMRHYEPVEAPPVPQGLFNVIYADPPWRYQFSPTYSREIEKNYPTMELEDIRSIQIPTPKDAILFLWATSPKLEEALSVLNSWGFEYRTSMVWVKDRIGMGYYFRAQHELILIGRKGKMPPPEESNRPSSVIVSPRRDHSQKPDEIYEMIEKMYPSGSYLELFSRDERENWTMWGNEAK